MEINKENTEENLCNFLYVEIHIEITKMNDNTSMLLQRKINNNFISTNLYYGQLSHCLNVSIKTK